ncbi:uncharacterized protein LOC134464903 [Engraulis encrasicolus]|uniref:uncharacterized protein LOC134464903 n=1 Tax=Engraulis encrasicolus TaxID=184585 RepID=UPI002FD18E40
MHWLPLVAMVIASALPFPHSPLPRLVAASSHSSQTQLNLTLNSSGSSPSSEPDFSSPAATVPVLDYSSHHGDVSQTDYSMAARKVEGEASERKAALGDLAQSTSYKGELEQQTIKLNPKNLKSEHHFLNSNTKDGAPEQQASTDGQSDSRQDTVDYKTGDQQSPGGHPSDYDDHITHGSDSESGRLDPDHIHTKERPAAAAAAAEGLAVQSSSSGHTTGLLVSEVVTTTSSDTLDHLPSTQTGVQHVSKTSAGLTRRESAENTLEPSRGAAADDESLRTESSEGDGGESHGAEVDLGVVMGLGMGPGSSLGVGGGLGGGDGALQAEEDLLFLDAHPRVLFSASSAPPRHPPLLLMLERGQLSGGEEEEDSGNWEHEEEEEDNNDVKGDTDAAGSYQNVLLGRTDAAAGAGVPPSSRSRRSLSAHNGGGHGREQSVCDERSDWVTDKRTAVDIHHRTVTIVAEIPTKTGPLKQYFYETRCREDSHRTSLAVAASAAHTHSDNAQQALGCRGVDKRQWNSSCQTKQSFVRALTQDANNRMGWRWIRINSSCVCVLLSRVTRNHPMIEGTAAGAGAGAGAAGARERQRTGATEGGRAEGRQVRAAMRRAGEGRRS